ncbi:MAG: hypothetical protein MJZ84_00360 [Paludibacteraceae bacterium]|nr:hypothetical protein [Paludibacteraceae bacterium]
MIKEELTLNNEATKLSMSSCRRNSAHMLPVTDWLSDLPETKKATDLVEITFKNTRKGYYRNSNNLPLEKGSVVVVGGNPGYDIGEVSLVGQLVLLQVKKNHIDFDRYEVRDIYRFATEEDLAKAAMAHAKEHETMIKARQLAKSLGLEMKIGDVEYQGDGGKAIFYYIADGRVDFRQLIKVYAETFRIRIEMKQIGARQEAGRIGGTGPCGRELCCSTWMTNFTSVGTGAARLQNIAPNPQKLAGQCAKLKCCLNYEVPIYEDAVAKLPDRRTPLETKDGVYYFFASDPLRGEVTYSTDHRVPANLQTITAVRANEIVEMNKRGEKPVSLEGKAITVEAREVGYMNVVGQDDLTRFDRKKGRKAEKQKGGETERQKGGETERQKGNKEQRHYEKNRRFDNNRH